jgi:hypothetical protein
MADGKGRMVDDRGEVRSGDQGGESTPEVSQGPIVGYDSNRVMDDSTNDKIGFLSHEGTKAAERPRQEAGDEHSLSCELKTPEKAPNEANLESTQGPLPYAVESPRRDWRVGNEANQLATLADAVATNSAMASDSTRICDVGSGRLPIPRLCRYGTRESRAHPDQTTFRSAPASRELNVRSG